MANYKNQFNKILRPYQSSLKQVTPEVHEHILKLALRYIDSGKLDIFSMEKHAKLTNSQSFFMEALAAHYLLFLNFWRVQAGLIKAPEMEEVLKDSKLNESCSKEVLKVLFQSRAPLNTLSLKRQTCQRVSWRINISTCHDSLKQTTILIKIQLDSWKDGSSEEKTLVLPVSTFHRLRFQTAKLLRNMQVLENRSSMKKS